MAAWRGRARSGEEPVAFRRMPAGEPTTVGSDWELALGPRSSDFASRSSRYNSAALARDLSGATATDFDAHDFVRRLLTELNDRPAVTASGVRGDVRTTGADGSLDADAALGALDAVEFLLARRRDIAVRDEASARDALRQQLHAALRQRDDATRAADAVAAALPAARTRASHAASELEAAASPLSRLVDRRARMAAARDLVLLLGASGAALHIVRASEMLALVRAADSEGALSRVLQSKDAARARDELRRCEDELAARLEDGLTDQAEHGAAALRDCAIAARNLQRERAFVHSYITRLPIFAQDVQPLARSALERTDDAGGADLVRVLASVRWECASALRGFVPVALATFPTPLVALALMVNTLFHEKLLRMAAYILSAVRAHAVSMDELAGEARAALDKSVDDDIAHGCVGQSARAMEMRCKAAAENSLAVRRRVAYCTTGLVKTLTSAVHELIELCLNSEACTNDTFIADDPLATCASQAHNVATMKHFGDTLVALRIFVFEQQRIYMVLEKQWAEQKVGNVFEAIGKIDAHASQLNHTEVGDTDAFDRYRSKISVTASDFVGMSRSAIASSLESLQRASTMLMLSGQVNSLLNAGEIDMNAASGLSENENENDGAANETNGTAALNQRPDVSIYEQGDDELKALIFSIAHGLVQAYLANSEALLQAASHLIPNSEHAARQREVWASGASPMSSYVHVIGALSKADASIDRFFASVVLDDVTVEPLSLGPLENDSLANVQSRMRIEARRELIMGLKRLALDTKLGVEAAATAAGAHVADILSTPGALDAYTDAPGGASRGSGTRGGPHARRATPGLETEATMGFVTASMFVERQLQACRSALSRNNAGYAAVVLAERVRDAVVQHWAACRGPFSKLGALLLMVNARAMVRAFAASAKGAQTISVLSVLAQLHFDSGDEIWGALEGGGLAKLGAGTILQVLEKRRDVEERSVRKIKDVLALHSPTSP